MTSDELEELEKQKAYWSRMGFRVVTFIDGKKANIEAAMKQIAKNHILDK